MNENELKKALQSLHLKYHLLGGHMFSAFGHFCINDLNNGIEKAEEAREIGRAHV